VALLGLGDVARDQGDVARTRWYSEESLALARDLGAQYAIGFSLNNLALAAYRAADLVRARDLIDESTTIFRAVQADSSLAEGLITRGHILREQGDGAGAAAALIEALRIAHAVGPRLLVPMALEGLATVLVQGKQASLAVRLLAAAAALREQMGTPIRPADRSILEQARAMVRSTLGADAFAAAWKAGELLPLDETLDAAGNAAPLVAS
jgi:tetratricopeptide (TPR) repeat protein